MVLCVLLLHTEAEILESATLYLSGACVLFLACRHFPTVPQLVRPGSVWDFDILCQWQF